MTPVGTRRTPRPARTPVVPQDPAARRRWLALAVLAVAQFMVFPDETVANVALPSIKTSLGFSQPSLAWVINAYVLVFGGLILLGGRAADLAGRRRIFLIGTAIFGRLPPIADLQSSSPARAPTACLPAIASTPSPQDRELAGAPARREEDLMPVT
jgi:MFS family permease